MQNQSTFIENILALLVLEILDDKDHRFYQFTNNRSDVRQVYSHSLHTFGYCNIISPVGIKIWMTTYWQYQGILLPAQEWW